MNPELHPVQVHELLEYALQLATEQAEQVPLDKEYPELQVLHEQLVDDNEAQLEIEQEIH